MPKPILYDDGSRLPAWRVAEIEDAAEEAKFSVWRAWIFSATENPAMRSFETTR